MSPQAAMEAAAFEQELGLTEVRAARQAERIIKLHFERHPLPVRDENNVLRLGWNRPIERNPEPVEVSSLRLRSEIAQTRQVLHRRVLSLQARRPISVLRLSVLYAIADLLGPDHVEAWEPLWQAIEAGDWPRVMQELLRCNWNGLVGNTEQKRMLFSRLITALIADATSPAWGS